MNQSKRMRRPEAGGYARGDETRQRIIEAALQLFGERGFDGASTRDIANAAGVNAPALQYYFENKAGVYQACAEYVAEDMQQRFEPPLRQAAALMRQDAGTAELIEAYLAIYDVALNSLLLQTQAPSSVLFMARELASGEDGAISRMLHQRLKQPLRKTSLALVARISGTPTGAAVTRIRTLMLRSHLMLFRFDQQTTLSVLGWKEINAARAELIRQTIRATTRTLLESWSAAAAKPA